MRIYPGILRIKPLRSPEVFEFVQGKVGQHDSDKNEKDVGKRRIHSGAGGV
jgi:hypothetical protein